MNRGLAYLQSEGYDNAAEDFKDAIEIKPAFPEAYFNLANVLTKQEKLAEACEAMKQASKLGYEPANAHINVLCTEK